MTDQEQERFEAELRRLKPAAPPEKVVAGLSTLCSKAVAHIAAPSKVVEPSFDLFRLLRWLTPAAALALVTVVVLWQSGPTSSNNKPQQAVSPATKEFDNSQALQADAVQIDQELISSFDAVAKLPSGEPVRFRCEQWVDQVRLSDKAQGLYIANRAPRIEVIPVRFETY